MGRVLGWVKFLGFRLVRGGFQVWDLFFYLYSICYFKHHSNETPFELKFKFEFKPSTQTKEKCTSMNAQAC